MDYIEQFGGIRAIGICAAWVAGSLMVGLKAKNDFYRSFSGWMFLALLFSPLTALIFLFVAGLPAEEWERAKAAMDRRKEMANRIEAARRIETQEQAMGFSKREGMTCQVCGHGVNLATREGIYSPEGEPWRIICEKCDSPIDTTDVV